MKCTDEDCGFPELGRGMTENLKREDAIDKTEVKEQVIEPNPVIAFTAEKIRALVAQLAENYDLLSDADRAEFWQLMFSDTYAAFALLSAGISPDEFGLLVENTDFDTAMQYLSEYSTRSSLVLRFIPEELKKNIACAYDGLRNAYLIKYRNVRLANS